jgi:four helix bundle protein
MSMKGIEKFEDLIAWQKARLLASAIYRITRDGTFGKDHGLCGQIQRAAVSIMSNIAEGYERGSATDYHHFLVIAKSSAQSFAHNSTWHLMQGILSKQISTT